MQKDAEAYTLESAACDADACTITPAPASAQSLQIAASPAAVAAGARVDARLRVTLKSRADGSLYAYTFVVRFARAARIRLVNGIDSPLPLLMPMLPGVELRMPQAIVVDGAGIPLEVEPGTLIEPSADDHFAPASDSSYDTRYHASRPGRARLTWELPCRQPAPPAWRTAGRRIVAEVRVLLADGRTALAALVQVETDRSGEAMCLPSESSFLLYRRGNAGVSGSVTVKAAGMSRTVPFALAP